MIPAFVNLSSGGRNADEARAALRAVGGFDIRDVAPAALAEGVRSAIREGAQRIVVAGGDGSIASAAAVLAGTMSELAIVPSGTLNHLARDLALPLDLEDAARLARDGHAVSADTGFVNDRIFLNTSSVGAYVTFVRVRDQLERRLRVGYHVSSFLAAARLLVHMPVFTVSLHVEGVSHSYLTPLVFIGVGERELKLPALGKRVAGGKTGLHVMVVRRRSAARAAALGLAAAARGVRAVSRTPALDSFLVEACRVEPRTNHITLDGEIVRVKRPLEYRHATGRLRIVGVAAATGVAAASRAR
jgi:diacylglycerol kinase family enzyme